MARAALAGPLLQALSAWALSVLARAYLVHAVIASPTISRPAFRRTSTEGCGQDKSKPSARAGLATSSTSAPFTEVIVPLRRDLAWPRPQPSASFSFTLSEVRQAFISVSVVAASHWA